MIIKHELVLPFMEAMNLLPDKLSIYYVKSHQQYYTVYKIKYASLYIPQQKLRS